MTHHNSFVPFSGISSVKSSEVGGNAARFASDMNGGKAHDFASMPSKFVADGIIKRSYDLIFSTVAIVLLLPLFAFFAAMIKFGSAGPVFFRQDRYGLNGKLFSIYKFRTMSQDLGDDTGITQTVLNDPRVTPIGRILRKTSFDELPQFFNIWKGEMSVVGPRPHVPGMLANGIDYEDFDSRYMLRHDVRPC